MRPRAHATSCRQQSRRGLVLAIATAALSVASAVVPAIADPHGGRGGGGKGGNSGSGGGGGAPLPALGATLIGQAIGGGAIYAVWRKRRARKQRPDRDA